MPLRLEVAETRYSQEPADASTPEQVFERQWALAILESVLKRLLKAGKGAITTPENLARASEQFFHALRYKGHLLLDDQQLTFSGSGRHTIIPLQAIQDLSLGRYPRIMNPLGLNFISVTYDQDGLTKRCFLTPMERVFGLPSHFNQVVDDWFSAIRAAATTATGHAPRTTPADQLGTPSSSPLLVGALLLLLTLGVLAFVTLTRRPAARERYSCSIWN